MVKTYGSEATTLLGDASNTADFGRDFGATLTEREVRWLMRYEFARRAEDIVWRRTRLGLRMSPEEIDALDQWIKLSSQANGN